MSAYPDLFWVRQRIDGPRVDDPAGRTSAALTELDLARVATPGQSVAVAVGSRGIANLSAIVRATVDHLRSIELEPFIVPAMGSHGGGTAAGQIAVLNGYGITEVAMGCPVRSQMNTTVVCSSRLGFPIHLDRLAASADHMVIVNRVKPHTTLDGPIESGLVKMLLVGLGKQQGAETYHRAVFDQSWETVATTAASELLRCASVLAGVAIVENGNDETAAIEGVAGSDLLVVEPQLLDRARDLLPRLPFTDTDIVLIDQIGKDISGTGWDTNALGRKGSLHSPSPDHVVRVGTVVVRGLTEATNGNSLGIGLAELCRSRVVEATDPASTRLNALTSGNLPAAMTPIHFETDRELLDACTARLGLRDLASARVCWLRSTLDLGTIGCSAAHIAEARERDELEILSDPTPLPIDANGNLPDLLPAPPTAGRQS